MAAGTEARAAAASTSVVVVVPGQETSQGGSGGRSSGVAIAEPIVDNAVGSLNVLPAGRVAAESDPRAPPRPSLLGGAPEVEAPGSVGTGVAAAVDGGSVFPPATTHRTAPLVGTNTAGDESSLAQPAYRDKAIEALIGVMRGLEFRFVLRTSPAPPCQLSPHPSNAAAGAATDCGRRGVDAAAGRTDVGGGGSGTTATAASKSAAESRGGGGGGWTVRVRSSRAEELLSDLLEREKTRFTQINRDGARALERLAVAIDKKGTPSNAATATTTTATSPFFLARTSFTATTAATAVPAVVVLTGSRNLPGAGQTAAGPGVASGASTSHFPLKLSGPGLGDKNSVFSMMIRGASLLGRHETATLLAVRCAEHFLDASDALASPRGPLGLGGGGGVGSPVKGMRRGGVGGSRNEGLGAVHLLLTSRAQGADRREVDVAVTTACAEFLAHALVVVIWAVPHATRAELFGDGGVGGGGNVGESRWQEGAAPAARVRRAAVLRCLARLMRHSMESDNARVRDKV